MVGEQSTSANLCSQLPTFTDPGALKYLLETLSTYNAELLLFQPGNFA